ncbi:MAG: DUF1592 domain-containing protein [Planctomycetaceae bacterium]
MRACLVWLAMLFVGTSGSLFAQPPSEKSTNAKSTPADAELPNVGAYLKQHCLRCHSGEKSKGDVRLDLLNLPTAQGEVAETWSQVAKVIASGEMPPPKEPRPSAKSTAEVLQTLRSKLGHKVASAPLALRRMNRVEYENTVRDLLGIDASLAELLPEDGSVQGFDNVADGLSISSILMERYLEAADLAFERTIRRVQPLPPETRRAVMMELADNISSVKEKKGGTIESAGAFVKFTPGWPPVRLDSAHPIERGVYRCRVAVWPHDPSDRTLAVSLFVGPLFGPGKRLPMGVFDVTGSPEEPRIIEFTTTMEEGHTVHIVPEVFPEHVTYRDKHEPRPGVAVAWVETHGPLDQEWPCLSEVKLFGPAEGLRHVDGLPIYMRHRRGVKQHVVDSDQPHEDVARVLRKFIPRAFRRPVDESLIQKYIDLAHSRLDAGRTFEQSVRAGVTAVLCSPQFLLLNREDVVDDYTIASRLSYFLWSTMPDDELLKLAAEGKLRDPQTQRQQVERMLQDPRSEQFVINFTGQWLKLRDIDFTTPDKKLYPEYDELLRDAMLRETRSFFRHLLDEDLSVLNAIDSDFTFLNERLARHYGIPDIKGHETMRLVKLPEESLRGGLMTHASVLKVTANGTSTSPILRGVWVLNNMLGQPPSPPPPGVPAVEPDIRGATSIRQQLDKHRSIESCARCHVAIDPPGFALESFDPIGGERSWYRSMGDGEKVKNVQYRVGPVVETDGITPDNRSFQNFREYRQLLLDAPQPVARAITQKLLIYATGRPITPADQEIVDDILATTSQQQHGLRSLIHAIVQSELFLRP